MSESRSIGSLIVKLVAEGVGAYKNDVNAAGSATDKMAKLSKQLDDALASQTAV
ncbi:MAG: hypothetical protein IPN53_05260 [Comamonadaceae bacterium]|nr:hypothetical protein [Comamonadaceae bacterium]